jgi:hypothetical protein
MVAKVSTAEMRGLNVPNHKVDLNSTMEAAQKRPAIVQNNVDLKKGMIFLKSIASSGGLFFSQLF